MRIVIAGNKTDLNEKRVISFDEQEQEFVDKKISHFEVSAKASTNINAMFRSIATAMPIKDTLDAIKAESVHIAQKDLLNGNKKQNSSCSC